MHLLVESYECAYFEPLILVIKNVSTKSNESLRNVSKIKYSLRLLSCFQMKSHHYCPDTKSMQRANPVTRCTVDGYRIFVSIQFESLLHLGLAIRGSRNCTCIPSHRNHPTASYHRNILYLELLLQQVSSQQYRYRWDHTCWRRSSRYRYLDGGHGGRVIWLRGLEVSITGTIFIPRIVPSVKG